LFIELNIQIQIGKLVKKYFFPMGLEKIFREPDSIKALKANIPFEDEDEGY